MFNISRYDQVNKYGDYWIYYMPLYLLHGCCWYKCKNVYKLNKIFTLLPKIFAFLKKLFSVLAQLNTKNTDRTIKCTKYR